MPLTERCCGDYLIRHDRVATSLAYDKLRNGDAFHCSCSGCRNFFAQRSTAFPPAVLALFQDLGIDPALEGEVFHFGRDPDSGLYLYGGWYYFVGVITKLGSEQKVDAFTFHFGTSFPKPPPAFHEHIVLAIDFLTHLPWLLPEPEPDPPRR